MTPAGAAGDDPSRSGPIGIPFPGLALAQYRGDGAAMRLLLILLTTLFLPALPGGTPASAQIRRLTPEARRVAPYDEAYERGFREGIRDARRGRTQMLEQRGPLRGGPRGELQRGYADGYRAGFTSERNTRMAPGTRRGWAAQGAASDPAYARGETDGYRRGFDDGHEGDRYDPTREGSYRDGDAGYFKKYGARDAYRRNYRDGFRHGYEDGYRDGARTPDR